MTLSTTQLYPLWLDLLRIAYYFCSRLRRHPAGDGHLAHGARGGHAHARTGGAAAAADGVAAREAHLVRVRVRVLDRVRVKLGLVRVRARPLPKQTAWPHAKRTSRSASQHTMHVRSLSYCAVSACAGAAVASPAAAAAAGRYPAGAPSSEP